MKSGHLILSALILFAAVAGCVSQGKAGDAAKTIQVDGNIEGFFSSSATKTIDDFEGVPLEGIIQSSGVSGPEAYTYTFVGGDGYQKTVKWEDVKQGILTRDGMVVFPHLPKMYQVRDVVEVHVNE